MIDRKWSRRHFIGLMTAGTGLLMGRLAAGASTAALPASPVMPDEAYPHARTFMQWPASRTVHPDPDFLDFLQQAVARIANTIVAFEPVVMLMHHDQVRAARRKLSQAVRVWDIPTDDLWCRDAGPVFLLGHDNRLTATTFNFNGWGNRQVHDADGLIAQRVAARLGIDLLNSGLVGEGGGIETDGQGTLMAHESSWINTNRNRLSSDEIERRLLAALGGTKMIWAPGLADHDITDFHIDAIARFAAPGHVLMQLPERSDRQDPFTRAAWRTHDILARSVDAQGMPLKITRIPDPTRSRVRTPDFVASYANYYVCNGAVIMAEFGDTDADAEARRAIGRFHPGREIIPINVDAIGMVGGGIHCATQQQPRSRMD